MPTETETFIGPIYAKDSPQVPTPGRIVMYNHPGSADGKYAPTQSPAIIRAVELVKPPNGDDEYYNCELFVFGPKGQHQDWSRQGTGGSMWNWPPRV